MYIESYHKEVSSMRSVVQRAKEAKVYVEGEIVGAIDHGLMVLVGVEPDDEQVDLEFMADKIANLRIFEDENDKMNLSVKDVGGKILLVSQFTLMGDCRKGRRPNFMGAARPEKANPTFEALKTKLETQYDLEVETGKFGAHMKVDFVNDGPVTLLLDSKKIF